MEGITSALGSLIKILAFLLVGMIGVFILLLVVFSWSGSNTERASYECVLRRMDHNIAEASTGSYHDTCMAAQGYRRVGSCQSGLFTAAPYFCFAPAWQFWR